TFALLACHRHVAAHFARELAGDRKAELRPAVAPCCERIGLGEILEQFCLVLGRYADTIIRDRKLDPFASVRHLAHPQRDLALFRELAGIAQRCCHAAEQRCELTCRPARAACRPLSVRARPGRRLSDHGIWAAIYMGWNTPGVCSARTLLSVNRTVTCTPSSSREVVIVPGARAASRSMLVLRGRISE